jgi:hypothetical protein
MVDGWMLGVGRCIKIVSISHFPLSVILSLSKDLPEPAASVILSLSKDLGDRAVREILRQAQDDRQKGALDERKGRSLFAD